MGQNYQKQLDTMQSPPLPQQCHSCLEDGQVPHLPLPKHGTLIMRLICSLLAQVCCKAEIDMALPSCVDKVTQAKIPIVTGGNGASDSTELLINGQWQSGTKGHS